MKKSYIYTLVFTLLIILVAACIAFGYSALINSEMGGSPSPDQSKAPQDEPAWKEQNEESTPSGAPTVDPTEPTEPTEPTISPEAALPPEPVLREQAGHAPTVVLDAGHGFGDVGCAGPETALGVYEYEYTLMMVYSLKAELEAAGIKVLLTHDGKTFPSVHELAELCDEYGVKFDPTKKTWEDNNTFSPYERAIYMNVLDAQYGVDFAFSVHINAHATNSELRGFDLDYCAQNHHSEKSKVYAEALRDKLMSEYPDRPLAYFEDSWDKSFIVTKFNSMPSALLETGYHTNPEDCANLKNEEWRNTLMKNAASAIIEVLENEYEER